MLSPIHILHTNTVSTYCRIFHFTNAKRKAEAKVNLSWATGLQEPFLCTGPSGRQCSAVKKNMDLEVKPTSFKPQFSHLLSWVT